MKNSRAITASFALMLAAATAASVLPASAQAPAPQPPVAGQPAPPPDGPRSERERRGPDDFGWGGRRFGHMERMSPADRAAFLDARIAGTKAGLKLTPEQDKLWPAAEAAARDAAKTMSEQHEKTRAAGKPADPIEGMRRMADNALVRGQALRKLSDAAGPLYAALDV